jgi:hypothetical protein
MKTVQEGIDAIHKAGWAVQGIGFNRHSTMRRETQWFCIIYAAAFGRYIWQRVDGKSYGPAQRTIIGEGSTILEAITNALKNLEGSDDQALYAALITSFTKAADVWS